MLDGHRVYVEEVSYIEGEAKSEIGLKLKNPFTFWHERDSEVIF